MNNVKEFEDYKAKKEPGSVSPKQKDMREYVKSLKNIVDIYNPQSGNVTSKKGKELKILTKQKILSRLPILLTQIQSGNNSNKSKNEIRQTLYSFIGQKHRLKLSIII